MSGQQRENRGKGYPRDDKDKSTLLGPVTPQSLPVSATNPLSLVIFILGLMSQQLTPQTGQPQTLQGPDRGLLPSDHLCFYHIMGLH